MAIICHDQRLLFIMAPHTGCTAVGTALRDELGGLFLPTDDIKDANGDVVVARKHSQLGDLLSGGVLGAQERAVLTVATSVRNPFDALVSHYLKVNQRLEADPKRREGATIAAKSFEGWLRFRFRPGVWLRIRGRQPDEVVRWTTGADVIMRHERLQDDFDQLMTRVGVGRRVVIPEVNVTGIRTTRHYQDFYTPTARALVEELYAADLAEFGYRFDPAEG